METRHHKLYRHSVTTGKCEDCGLIDNHSNACHDAAPIRKIEELYDKLDKLSVESQDYKGSADLWATRWLRLKENFEKLGLENRGLRDVLAKIGMASLTASTLGFLRRKIEEAVNPVLATLLEKGGDDMGNPWAPNKDYPGKPVQKQELKFPEDCKPCPRCQSLKFYEGECLTCLKFQLNHLKEALELLEESIEYAGLDPTAEDADRIHAWEKKARELLDKARKTKMDISSEWLTKVAKRAAEEEEELCKKCGLPAHAHRLTDGCPTP